MASVAAAAAGLSDAWPSAGGVAADMIERSAGRSREEAIPVLEARLVIPNQTETVQAELAKARRQADD